MLQRAQPDSKPAQTLRHKKQPAGEVTVVPEIAHPSNTQLNPAHVLSLQRTYGNQFVQRLVRKQKQTGVVQRNPQPGDEDFVGPLTPEQTETKEKKAIVARIKKDYGIELDDNAGIVAVTKLYFKDQSLANKNPLGLAGQGWTLDQLRALEDVLKLYAPILGAARMRSTLAGKAQGVRTFSRVDMGIDFQEYTDASVIDQAVASGVPLTDLRLIASMDDVTAAAAGVDLGLRDKIRDALVNYDQREADVTAGDAKKSGYGDDHYAKKDPDTLGEAFRSEKNVSLYNSFTTNNSAVLGSLSDTMRQSIAHELSHVLIEEHQLSHFVGTFSSYWIDQNTRVSGDNKIAADTVEAPITNYGATNAAEDLAETAGFFFVKPDVLTNGNTIQNPTKQKGKPGNPAPDRKDYMDRVVAEWTSANIKTFGTKSDAVLKLTEASTMSDLSTIHADAIVAYRALSSEEKTKVKAQYDKMEAHYQGLLAKKRPPVPTK